MKKYLLIATAVIAALVGCKKQTQSEVDFADVKQNATVSGQVVYLANQAGAATDEMKMEGVRVYFLADANAYAKVSEKKQFEAVTDADGKFSLIIPTGEKSISGRLMIDEFSAEQAGKTIWFQAVEANYTLVAGQEYTKKIVLGLDVALSELPGKALVEGVVSYSASSAGQTEVLTPKADAVVRATVPYEAGSKTFVAKTDANGRYSFTIPAKMEVSYAVKLKVEQFVAAYTKELNGAWVSENYYFDTEYDFVDIKDGDAVIKDFRAYMGDLVAPSTAMDIKFTVSGMIEKEIEAITRDDKKATGVESSKVPYVGNAVIEVYNSYEGKSLFYDVTSDAEGKYSKEVAMYNAWDINDVAVKVYVKEEIPATIEHYYLGYTKKDGYYYTKIHSWCNAEGEDSFETQLISGVYNKVTNYEYAQPSLYAPLKMENLVLLFSIEEAALQDVMGVPGGHCREDLVPWENKDTGKTQNLEVASDGYQWPVK